MLGCVLISSAHDLEHTHPVTFFMCRIHRIPRTCAADPSLSHLSLGDFATPRRGRSDQYGMVENSVPVAEGHMPQVKDGKEKDQRRISKEPEESWKRVTGVLYPIQTRGRSVGRTSITASGHRLTLERRPLRRNREKGAMG